MPWFPHTQRITRPPDDFGAWVVAAICVLSAIGHVWDSSARLLDERPPAPKPASAPPPPPG
ncbi:hypothetical protein [Streptomyces sp. NPDC001985]|uniref:hypothetical protein n=1 Tax=Streptomyces sp. NPDC001985 TaxID=3154406 RepID=UPI003333A3B1